jgi:uncharacterized protein (DUF2336 family)
MPDAPRALILRLARDIAMPVAEPVIRLSPLLSEADLLALVSAPPVPDTVTAVARRPALSEALCDAILERAEPGMVTVLLANPSAAIRESTLDGLIASAAEHTEWHEPLVQRPRLSAGAVRTLGEIVAAELLRLLAARADLSPELTVELQARLAARLAEAEPALTPEEAFAAAARAGDRDAMVRLLAEAARLPPAAVLHAVSLRNAKALCSLCWQAGYSTTSLATVQLVLGQLPPAQALAAAPGPSWPLGPDEMQWQLELLGSL